MSNLSAAGPSNFYSQRVLWRFQEAWLIHQYSRLCSVGTLTDLQGQFLQPCKVCPSLCCKQGGRLASLADLLGFCKCQNPGRSARAAVFTTKSKVARLQALPTSANFLQTAEDCKLTHQSFCRALVAHKALQGWNFRRFAALPGLFCNLAVLELW